MQKESIPLQENLQLYLQPTNFIDYDSPIVRETVASLTERYMSPTEKLKKLFDYVRDIPYDPDQPLNSREAYRASNTLKRASEGEGANCIQKATLYTGSVREIDIPAGLGFANIRNHRLSERLRKLWGGDILIYHGFSVVYLNNMWVKVSPTWRT